MMKAEVIAPMSMSSTSMVAASVGGKNRLAAIRPKNPRTVSAPIAVRPFAA